MNKTQGTVYLVKCGDYYKIGRTKNFAQRFYCLQRYLPIQLDAVATVQVEDNIKCERYFHRFLKNKRVRGEWFELSHKDVSYMIAEFNDIASLEASYLTII